MKLDRLSCEPSALIGFYEEGLSALGAVCERSWHDRLQLVAEGAAARLWHPEGALFETELSFPSPDHPGPRDAAREVFPGCPLTFRLVETLRLTPPTLRRAVLRPFDQNKPPAPDVAARLWQMQHPNCVRWTMTKPLTPAWHYSVLMLVRCEIQAIDQHWSLHRVVLSLPDGQRDESLAAALEFSQLDANPTPVPAWPQINTISWESLLQQALREELAADLESINHRQEQYLRRELDRVEDYFADYEKELLERLGRSRQETVKAKINDRLTAAKAERLRRRQDQIDRHQIRICPHLDALLLLAEPAWRTTVKYLRDRQEHTAEAVHIPRGRRWIVERETAS